MPSTVASRAVAAASRVARRVTGEAVTYTRDSTTITVSFARRGSTNWNAQAVYNGSRIGDRSVDWLIDVADLVDSSGAALGDPVRGDTITDADGTVFRVMPFGPDDQLWQWHDRVGQTTYRIHTKERT